MAHLGLKSGLVESLQLQKDALCEDVERFRAKLRVETPRPSFLTTEGDAQRETGLSMETVQRMHAVVAAYPSYPSDVLARILVGRCTNGQSLLSLGRENLGIAHAALRQKGTYPNMTMMMTRMVMNR